MLVWLHLLVLLCVMVLHCVQLVCLGALLVRLGVFLVCHGAQVVGLGILQLHLGRMLFHLGGLPVLLCVLVILLAQLVRVGALLARHAPAAVRKRWNEWQLDLLIWQRLPRGLCGPVVDSVRYHRDEFVNLLVFLVANAEQQHLHTIYTILEVAKTQAVGKLALVACEPWRRLRGRRNHF